MSKRYKLLPIIRGSHFTFEAMYKLIIKPILFQLDPEKAHRVTLAILDFIAAYSFTRFLFKLFFIGNLKNETVELMGLQFKNRVGLAAGFDKNAEHIESFALLGFGHIEVGTVTPLPQSGNDLPRLFRLPKDEALINRMGFNNRGVKVMATRLKFLREKKLDIIIGGNIGKNKITPNDKAVDDYVICFYELFDVVDYFVVNVSSPNTLGLRELQDKEPLTHLLQTLQAINQSKPNPKPMLLKIAPDVSNTQLDEIIEIVTQTNFNGIIATNTTIDRSELITSKPLIESIGAGGLSGKVLLSKSNKVLEYIHSKNNKLILIGVGGIHNSKDAKLKFDTGASLIQIYTGLVYEGPELIKNIINNN